MNRRTSLHVFSDLWLATLAEWFCSLSGPLVGLRELCRSPECRCTLSARRWLTVQVKSRHEVSLSERILCRGAREFDTCRSDGTQGRRVAIFVHGPIHSIHARRLSPLPLFNRVICRKIGRVNVRQNGAFSLSAVVVARASPQALPSRPAALCEFLSRLGCNGGGFRRSATWKRAYLPSLHLARKQISAARL